MDQTTNLSPYDAETEALVRQFAETEAALAARLGSDVDAVVDPATGLPLPLRHAWIEFHQSEQRLQRLLEQIPSIVWTTDPDMVCTYAAGSALAQVGLSPANLVSRSVSEFLPGAAQGAQIIHAHRQALAGQQATLEGVWAGVAYQVWIEPFRDRQGKVAGCIGIGVDISERVRLEEELRAARDDLEIRVEARTAELAVRADATAAAYEELAAQHEELRIQERELRSMNMELFAAEQRAVAERRRYQELFDSAPDAYLVTDPWGTIREANQAAAELLGARQEYLIDKPLGLFEFVTDKRTLYERMERLRRGEASEFHNWIVRLQPRGRAPVEGSISVSAIHGSDGRATGQRWLIRDVSDRVRLRRERETRLARLALTSEVSQHVLSETTVEGLLQCVADAARELTGARFGASGHGYVDGVFRVGATSRADDAPLCPLGEVFTVQRGGVYMELIMDRASIRLTDAELRRHPAWWGLPGDHAPLRGLLGARLVGHDGQANGLIMVSDKQGGGEFSAEDEALLAQLAATTSLALQHIEARQEAERRANELETLFGSISDGILVYDAAGTVVRANQSVSDIMGLDPFGSSREERRKVLGTSYPDGRLVPLEELPSSRALRGERVQSQPLHLVSARGEQRAILASAAPLRERGQVVGAVAVWHDITALEEAQRERECLLDESRSQREFLEQLMDAAPVGIAVIGAEDYRYQYLNLHGQSLLGMSAAQIVGHAVSEVMPPLTAQRAMDDIDQVRRTGEMMRLRGYRAFVGPEGKEMYLNMDRVPLRGSDGRVDRVLLLVVEVTEHVRARQRIEELARFPAENPYPVLRVGQEGRILYANSSSQAVLEFWGCQVDQLLPEEWRSVITEVQRSGSGRELEFTYQDRIYALSLTPVLPAGYVNVYGRDTTERKQAEEAQRESEERAKASAEELQAILDVAPVAIWIAHDPECRRITGNAYADEIMQTAHGSNVSLSAKPGEATVSYRVFCDGVELRTKDLPAQLAAATGKVVPSFELELLFSNGRSLHLLEGGAPLFDAQGHVRGAVATGVDVTPLKRAEERLRQYAERLRVLHGVDQAILAARTEQEMIEAVLSQVSRLLPCHSADVIAYDLEARHMVPLGVSGASKAVLPVGQRQPFAGDWLPLVEGLARGEGYVFEDLHALPPADLGSARFQTEGMQAVITEPVWMQGRWVGALNISFTVPGPLPREYLEVTHELATVLSIGIRQARLHEQVQQHTRELEERVRVRTKELSARTRELTQRTAALEVSEARFRAIFEQAAIGMALVDRAGHLTATNPALQEMLDYSARELEGKGLASLVAADGDGDPADPLRHLLAGRRSYQMLEQRYARKDGQIVDVDVVLSLVRPGRGRARFAIAMVEDVTQRKRAQAGLIQAEKLALTGRLAASMAHEINNPLQSVIGCLGLAQELVEGHEDPRPYMQVAMNELERAARIVHQLRDLNRRREFDKELANVNELVEQALLLTQKRCQNRQVAVTWQAATDLPSLLLAPDRIQQVLLNLVLNAIEAMPDGGQLCIHTQRTAGPPGAEIVVEDTGVGIPVEQMERLFEPFQSTKEVGVGMGLYVSREIILEHGGHIDIQSEVGQGTMFTIWLPAESA